MKWTGWMLAALLAASLNGCMVMHPMMEDMGMEESHAAHHAGGHHDDGEGEHESED